MKKLFIKYMMSSYICNFLGKEWLFLRASVPITGFMSLGMILGMFDFPGWKWIAMFGASLYFVSRIRFKVKRSDLDSVQLRIEDGKRLNMGLDLPTNKIYPLLLNMIFFFSIIIVGLIKYL